MKQHFMSVYNYSTKNRAHAEFQKFVNQYHYCLVDDTRLTEIIEEFKAEIQNIKEKYPRCDLIKLETWSHTEGALAIAVSGNFKMDVHQVRRVEYCHDQEPTSLSVMDIMTKDDNQGIRMSSTVTGVKEVPQGSIISFGVENQIGKDALAQVCGHPGEYMIFCMAVNKAELEKTREKMKGVTE